MCKARFGTGMPKIVAMFFPRIFKGTARNNGNADEDLDLVGRPASAPWNGRPACQWLW
jgi:hypothetical protein